MGRVGVLAAALGIGLMTAGVGMAAADTGAETESSPSSSSADHGAPAPSRSAGRTSAGRGGAPRPDRNAGGDGDVAAVPATVGGAGLAALIRNTPATPVTPAAVAVAPKSDHGFAGSVDGAAHAPAAAAAVRPGAVVASLPTLSVHDIAAHVPSSLTALPSMSLPHLAAQPLPAAIVPSATPVFSDLISTFASAPRTSFSLPSVAAAPVLTAPPASVLEGAFGGLLQRLASGSGLPAESPAAWAVLEAARRFTRQIGLAPTGATLTTGQPRALAAATTGTTTTITWNWGTYPVISFNPATDKLDFGWMTPTDFDVTENAGSTVIAVVGNDHSYTLQNVGISQLSMNNIIASDTATVSKWQNIIATAQGSTTPTVSIANATVAEGNSGTKPLAFTVSLSKASTSPVTVNYATANGTATAGADYTAASGTLTFAPGVTSQTVNVSVTGDATVEPDETFTVTLASPAGATLGAATATGTITNDDVSTTPTVSIANATVNEGNSGNTNAAFTVSLSKASTSPVTVNYATSNGTATAGTDYTATSGTVTFAAGTTAQTVNVAVTGDTTVEPNETFTVTLTSPSGATLGTATATGTITNDDVAQSGTAQWGNAFFAPYADMGGWPTPDLLSITKTNGGSLFTAAFLQADPNGQAAWAGLSVLKPGGTDDQAKAIDNSIKSLRAAGGDVMISMGGASGTSLAQYYASHGKTAQQLADAYVGVIDYYGVSHIDFDIEGAAIADAPSVALNSQALKIVQQARPNTQIWYTLPVLPTGLTPEGVKVVDSALAAGVKLAGVNLMAMDYGDSAAPTTGSNAKSMSAYAIQAADSSYAQLSTLHNKYGQTFGYKQLGVTPMIGVNDVTTEVFTVADAQALEDYARAKGLGMIGMWSVTRDTPGDLGQATPTSSGLSDPAGSFSKVFNDYGTINTVTYPTTVV